MTIDAVPQSHLDICTGCVADVVDERIMRADPSDAYADMREDGVSHDGDGASACEGDGFAQMLPAAEDGCDRLLPDARRRRLRLDEPMHGDARRRGTQRNREIS